MQTDLFSFRPNLFSAKSGRTTRHNQKPQIETQFKPVPVLEKKDTIHFSGKAGDETANQRKERYKQNCKDVGLSTEEIEAIIQEVSSFPRINNYPSRKKSGVQRSEECKQLKNAYEVRCGNREILPLKGWFKDKTEELALKEGVISGKDVPSIELALKIAKHLRDSDDSQAVFTVFEVLEYFRNKTIRL
jgi:hypothetical protein